MIERYRTMKNSLFKRAIAAASAVPVALTQCLSVANAVSVDYTAPVAAKSADTSFTLDKKGTIEDEMAGWHHRHNGHGFRWTPAVGDGQGGLACCGSRGRKESETTE